MGKERERGCRAEVEGGRGERLALTPRRSDFEKLKRGAAEERGGGAVEREGGAVEKEERRATKERSSNIGKKKKVSC
jgi:hypothetical protein